MIRTKFYHAYYEDAAKIEAAAKEAGYTGESGQSWFDFVDASMSKYRQNGYFDTVKKAEDWLKESISAEKACFGTGTILYMEQAKKHCDNCMCGSVWAMREYSVDASGIVEENALEPPCEDLV